MLNGMSEQEFYDMYPTKEDWDNAQQMKLGGLSGAPHNGQPTADEFFSYGSHYNDSVNVPMGNPYYAAEGGTPYYGGPTRPYVYGGGLPGGANEYDMPCMNCGGYMEQGGDYNSPTNYGSFNVPMAYGGIEQYQTAGEFVNPELKAFLQQRNVGNIKNTPSNVKKYKAENNDLSRLYPNKNNFDLRVEGQRFPTDSVVSIPNNPQFQAAYRNGKFTIAGTTPAGIKQAASINEGSLKQGKDKMIYADYSDIYKEDGGILDASNNMSYPTFEDGGKYNLLNLIKAASKKMKKAYGGDTVTQGGNSDNYPQGITQAFKNGIKNNTMNALMNEEHDSFSNEIKQMGGFSVGGYTDNYNMGYNQGNMYNDYNNGYNQGPQLNPQNQAMQGMYQQRVDNLQNNVDQSGQDFMNTGAAFAKTYNPKTTTTVTAADGIQVLLNKQTGKPFTADEYDQYQKYFGKDNTQESSTNTRQPKGNIYNYGQGQGTNYFPMNYRPYNKISRADDAMFRQLAANPSTNLKEYKNWNAPLGFGRTKMKFGYKDVNPEFTPTGNATFNLPNDQPKFGPGSVDNGRTRTPGGMYPSGQNLLDMLPNASNFDKANSSLQQPMNQEAPPSLSGDWNSMLNNKQLLPPSIGSKAYGGVSKYQMAGQFPSWGSPIGGNTQTPTPQSAGFGQNPIMMNGVTDQAAPITSAKTTGFEGTTGPEKEATITQKRRPGFNKEAAVNWGLAGMNALSSRLEQNQDRSAKQLADKQIAGNAFLAKPANAASQGDYNINSGDFRENQKVPVQFAGNSFANSRTGFAKHGGYMQEGGMQEQQPNPQQVMQGVATMLQQGAKPEQVAKQLVEMGIPQEQVVQIIQTVMQQLQGGQEGQQEPQQQPMRYGGFATGGAAEEESYEEDLNEDEIAELRAQGYDVEYI